MPGFAGRPTAVAGSFYPARAIQLARQVDALLGAARAASRRVPKALIVPHAGYIYSGPIAATGYAQLRPAAERIHRVVLLGPSHFVPVSGLALPEAELLQTPLGEVSVDLDARKVVEKLPGVIASARAHADEHSIEVQLPFLQRLLGDFQVVPLAVGVASPSVIAAVLDALWGDQSTCIVVSSDLSHYLPYTDAVEMDRRTAERIIGSAALLASEDACGAEPINGLLVSTRKRGLRPELLDLRNSGDTAGSRGEVVGYGAFAFYEGDDVQ